MPYIKQTNRPKYDKVIKDLFDSFVEPSMIPDNLGGFVGYEKKNYKDSYRIPVGDVNYVISTVLWKMFDFKSSYANGNDIVGVLECIKQEFLRRRLNDYEDKKIAENGDI